MATLGNPRNTIEILKKYNVVFQKRYGQNFLIDPHVLEKIIRAADITKKDFVLEIGPGIGTMTQYLCEAAGEVAAVEIDRELIPVLQDTLSAYDNVSIICGDILKTDIEAVFRSRRLVRQSGWHPQGNVEVPASEETFKVVANLPYYITTPIVMALLEKTLPVESITVMVQKEVAQRMQAGPGTKDYGALSLAVQYYSRAEIIANVPPNCFMPRPQVGSAVVRLTKYEQPPVAVSNAGQMFSIIRASFEQRRKTLPNSVGNHRSLPWTKEQIAGALYAMGLPENIRGETLSLEQFAQLSDTLTRLWCS